MSKECSHVKYALAERFAGHRYLSSWSTGAFESRMGYRDERDGRAKIGVGLTVQERANTRDSITLMQAVEMAILAEELGYAGVLTLEHHMTGYSMTPSPLQTLTYIAARTQNLWLGTGILALPLWHPIQLAEQMMVLDILSQGRCIFGVGQGRKKSHNYPLLRPTHGNSWTSTAFDEALGIILELLDNEVIDYRGNCFDSFKGGIRPWCPNTIGERVFATVSEESASIAAQHVSGVVLATDDPNAVSSMSLFRQLVESSGRNPQRPVVVARAHYHEDAQYAHQCAVRWRRSEAAEARIYAGGQILEPVTVIQDVVGDQQMCGDKLLEIVGTYDPEFIFLEFDFGGMPYADVERSMRGFAKHVLPRYTCPQ
jgi:alkanesulfonate monooxygenase SsuD/methylene tetrahydromethanopterin reductase-like flavin-dependent oxidoreductase (luciferase family)